MGEYKTYYSINRWWYHIRNILWFPVYLVAKIFPKRDICIFGSMSGYAVADNSKYLFINTYKNNYYWITKNKNILDKEILPAVFPVYAYSLRGIFLQLIAKKAYYTHKLDDFVAPLVMGAEIIALWHGVPFKKIGAAEKEEVSASSGKKLYRKLRAKLCPYSYYMHCNSVICPDEKFRAAYVHAFEYVNPRILIEQLPRITYAKKSPKEKKILYAPTYRKYRTLVDVLKKTGITSTHFSDWLVQNEYILVIRPHPIDAESLAEKGLVENYELDISRDIYESITKYVALITDYSSLIYDAEILGLKVLLLADDFADYLAENGFFEFGEKRIRNESVASVHDLIPKLERLIANEE